MHKEPHLLQRVVLAVRLFAVADAYALERRLRPGYQAAGGWPARGMLGLLIIAVAAPHAVLTDYGLEAIDTLESVFAEEQGQSAEEREQALLDQDIQRVLLELMAPKPTTLADPQAFQQDRVEKKEILMTFTADYLKNATAVYQNGLQLIREKKWPEAIQALNRIQGPPALQEDAAQKSAILRKIIFVDEAGVALDSTQKTS